MQSEAVERQFDGRRPWTTLVRLYWPERRSVVWALVSYLFKASPVWILPVITANLIDLIAHHPAGGLRLLWLNALVGGVAIIQNIPSAALYVTFLSRSIRNVEVRLRSALVHRLQILSISFYHRTDAGAMQTKITRDVESVEMMTRQIVDVGYFAVVTVLVTLGVIAWRMPVFLPVFIVFVPLVWLVRWAVAGRLQSYNENLRKEIEGMNSQLGGMIQMIPITRAHAVEAEEVARLETRFRQVRRAARSFDFFAGTFGATMWVGLMLFNLGGFTVAAWLCYTGRLALTPGDIVLLAGYFNTVMAAVLQLNAMLPVVTRGCDALRSIGEVLECPDIEENRGKQPVAVVRGEIVFENVSFNYDRTGTAPAALNRINLRVSPGEAVGIVGPSGSGKSTLISLITGFHRPTGGRILLDGMDMNAIDLRTFRPSLAVVGQQTILFNGTVRENIVYGTSGVTETALWTAIRDAGAEAFIGELPQGVETELGAAGVQLSGGQRQRIAIARALLRNPRVLILDEATSALDAGSEAVIQRALERLMAGRTTFLISHRPGVLKGVTRVVTLDRGEIKPVVPQTSVAGGSESSV